MTTSPSWTWRRTGNEGHPGPGDDRRCWTADAGVMVDRPAGAELHRRERLVEASSRFRRDHLVPLDDPGGTDVGSLSWWHCLIIAAPGPSSPTTIRVPTWAGHRPPSPSSWRRVTPRSA